MDEKYFKNYKESLRDRIHRNISVSDDAINLMFGMMRSTHSTEGASLYAINDYLDRKGW